MAGLVSGAGFDEDLAPTRIRCPLEVTACGNSMEREGITQDQLTKGVIVVPSAVIHLAQQQWRAPPTCASEVIFLVIALGILVGAVMGLVGAGGGIISVPVLVGLVGVPVADAMTASLVMAIASASTAVVPRLRGGVDWPVAAAVSAAGIPAALAGTAVNALLRSRCS